MKKQLLISTALLALAGTPIQQVVHAQSTTHLQQMIQYSVFENKEYGITVKVDPGTHHPIQTVEIEVLSTKADIQKVLKNPPKALEDEDFDLLVIHFLDSKGEPVKEVVSEIQVETRSLRGELAHVLYLTDDAGYKTLPFETTSHTVSFVTDKTHDFALVYKRGNQTMRHDTDKLTEIVSFSNNDHDTKKLEEIVAISTSDTPDEKKLNEIVAISSEDKTDASSDETDTKKDETKEALPKLDVTEVVVAKEETDKKASEKDTDKKEENPSDDVAAVTPEKTEEAPHIGNVDNPTISPAEEVTLPETPVTSVGTSVVAEELPVFDWLADDDGDHFTNGTELTLLTNPHDSDSLPPLPDVLYKHANYFLNRASAEAFIEAYKKVDDSVKDFEIMEMTDDIGRTYFNIDFKRPYVESSEESDNGTTTEESVTDHTVTPPAVTTETETPTEATPDKGNGGSKNDTENTEASDTPSDTTQPIDKQPLPDGMSESLRERHEEFLRNGFEYRGIENGEYLYGKGDVNAAPHVSTDGLVEVTNNGDTANNQP